MPIVRIGYKWIYTLRGFNFLSRRYNESIYRNNCHKRQFFFDNLIFSEQKWDNFKKPDENSIRRISNYIYISTYFYLYRNKSVLLKVSEFLCNRLFPMIFSMENNACQLTFYWRKLAILLILFVSVIHWFFVCQTNTSRFI